MPLETPNLDDLSYAELLDEARAALPAHYPGWTDHNASDPGIVLVELLAWMSEMVLYRVNQVPDASYRTFLKLLRGAAPPVEQELGEAIFETIGSLRERYRAVTPDDYEHLVVNEYPTSPAFVAPSPVKVRCLGERNFEAVGTAKYDEAPGQVSVVLLPEGPEATPWQQPAPAVLAAVRGFLDERRVLTTRLHVVGPTYVEITITATLYLRADAVAADVRAAAAQALFRYFHPLWGGAAGEGWPIGRNVHVSEVHDVLEGVRGLDFVRDVELLLPLPDPLRNDDEGGTLAALRLYDDELPRIDPPGDDVNLQQVFLTMEKRGGTWVPTDS